MNLTAWLAILGILAIPFLIVQALQEIGFDASLTFVGYMLMMLIMALCIIILQSSIYVIVANHMKEFTMQILKAQARSAGTKSPWRVN